MFDEINGQVRYYEWTDQMQEEAEGVLQGEAETKLTDMTYKRLDIDAKRNWDIFYRNNATNFYKDRHYLAREFTELAEALQAQKDLVDKGEESKEVVLLDLGCGVGNAFWPLVETFKMPPLRVQCCDFSKRAVNFVKENILYSPDHIQADVCDLVNDVIPFEPRTAQYA